MQYTWLPSGRLKQATVSEQEDEEERLRWRVEAEVKLQLDAAHAAATQQVAALQKQLASAHSQLQHLRGDVDVQQAAVESRDLEIQNLQVTSRRLSKGIPCSGRPRQP